MTRKYAHHWDIWEDGGSGTWLYVRRSGLTYVFIEITDLVDAMGRDATEQWAGEVAIVDLESVSPETLAAAVRSCGNEDEPPDLTTERGLNEAAYCLRSYGAKAPMWNDSRGRPRDNASEESKDFLALRVAARREAERYLDEATRESALDSKIVNAIGQTAREYMSGTEGLWSVLRRIRDAGEAATPNQRLVLAMYGKCETTLGAGPIPEDIRR